MSVFFMRRRMIVQEKMVCGNIFSEKHAKNWQLDSKFLYLHIKKRSNRNYLFL